MEILRVLKIFLYIFILMLALLLLKGLSTFEYSLRDKTVTYVDVMVEEFDSDNNGKGMLDVFKRDDTNKIANHLTVDLGAIDSASRILTLYEKEVVAQDSGYLELKYRAEASPYLRAHIAWQDKAGIKHAFWDIDQTQTESVTIKTELIDFNQFAKLIIELDKEAQKEAITKDSLSRDKSSHMGNIYLDYFKMISAVTPKPAF